MSFPPFLSLCGSGGKYCALGGGGGRGKEVFLGGWWWWMSGMCTEQRVSFAVEPEEGHVRGRHAQLCVSVLNHF